MKRFVMLCISLFLILIAVNVFAFDSKSGTKAGNLKKPQYRSNLLRTPHVTKGDQQIAAARPSEVSADESSECFFCGKYSLTHDGRCMVVEIP